VSERRHGSAEPEVEIVSELESVAEEWEQLADSAACPPFLRPGWFQAWLDAFGGGVPQLVCVRRSGALVGVLPMRLQRGRLRPIANVHTPQFGLVAADDAARAELLDAAFQHRSGRVELDLLDVDSAWVDSAAAMARARGRAVLAREAVRSPVIELRGDFDSYLERLSRNRRKGLRRQRRRLEELGELRLDIVHDGRNLDGHLEELFRIEASGWKGRRGTAIASAADTHAFYTRVAHWAADRGWLRLGFLRLGDRAIACDYSLQCDGVWYSLKAGYDEELGHCGPGAVMLQLELERCFEHGLERFELLGDADPFKLSWTDRCERRYALSAVNPTPIGLAALSVQATRQWLRPLVRRVRGRTDALGLYAAGASYEIHPLSGVWQFASHLPV
jgi:CelD/BcsL family acetyltransferase involved in cellulose biosynthesis